MASVARSRYRLPRVPHAERPRPDERVMKRTGADLQNGWLARHGTLTLTTDRLVFVPTVLDHVLRAKRREIPLGEITEIERYPLNPGDIPPGGRRPRMLLHTEACVYQFMVGDLDAWIDILERVYHLRSRRGLEPVPVIRREGHENVLLAEE